jgi:nitroreductase
MHTPSASCATAADVIDRLLAERHSCRAFLPQPVDIEVQRRFLETAQRTASWCNSQAWQVTVASGAAVERFREAMYNAARTGTDKGSDFPFPREYTGPYLARRRECGFQLYKAVGVERGDKAGGGRQALENFRLFGAPHVAILTSDADLGVYGAVDVGGYVQVLLLAMQAHGVAAIPQAALASQSALAKSLLGIDPARQVVCGISFGYEDASHPANSYRTSRASLDEVVNWVSD